MKIHSISRTKPSEWVGKVDTASSSQSEGRGFASRLVFFFSKYFLHAIISDNDCLNIAQTFKNSCFNAVLLYLNEIGLLKKTTT